MDQNATGIEASGSPSTSKTRSPLRRFAATLAILACTSGTALASPAKPNILFFGNSFTQSYFPKDIPTLLADIHVAAQKPIGTFYRRTSSGYSFLAHLQNTAPTETVQYLATGVLPAGETWDYVVLQGNSTECTVAFGDPAGFLSNGQAIFDTIAASHPEAKALAFETWARNENIAGYYPTPFPNPAAMQREIAANYRQLYGNLLAAHGAGSARYAGVGDAFAGLNWSGTIYNNDYYHANNRGELLVALTLYGALYGPTATMLAQSGVLDAVAASIYLSPADVLPMAIAADAAGTRRGDADLDWDVDFDDLLVLAQNYGGMTDELHSVTWNTGDFDVNGRVNFDDLLALAQNYGGTLSSPQTATLGQGFAADWALAQSLVPEPATVVIAGAAMGLRRRR